MWGTCRNPCRVSDSAASDFMERNLTIYCSVSFDVCASATCWLSLMKWKKLTLENVYLKSPVHTNVGNYDFLLGKRLCSLCCNDLTCYKIHLVKFDRTTSLLLVSFQITWVSYFLQQCKCMSVLTFLRFDLCETLMRLFHIFIYILIL